MKTAKEKLESENSKLKDEIAEMIRVNEAIFESGSKLDIRPEDLPNRFSKLLPVYFWFQGWRINWIFSNAEGETESEVC